MSDKIGTVEIDFTAVDIETTGLSPSRDEIIEIAAVRVRNGRIEGEFSTLVSTAHPISYGAMRVNGITPGELEGAPEPEAALVSFFDFLGSDVVVFHNAGFDLGFIRNAARRYLDKTVKNRFLDTLVLARKALPELGWYRLGHIAGHFGFELPTHRALTDARATARILLAILPSLASRGITEVEAMVDLCSYRDRKLARPDPELARYLPDSSGVYLMLDDDNSVLYAGKAKNLKRRVSWYFQNTWKPRKIERLIGEVKRVEFIRTGSELGALLLENRLIKSYWPPYNHLGKRTGRHVFVHLDDSDFPRPAVVTKLSGPGTYYGPFGSRKTLETLVELIRDELGLRRCRKIEDGPCFYYELKRCSGPCTGSLDKAGYAARLLPVTAAFEGRPERLESALVRRLKLAAARMDYEKAACYRNAVSALRRVSKIMRPFDAEGPCLDFVLLSMDEGKGYLVSRGGLASSFSTTCLANGRGQTRLFKKIAKTYFALEPGVPDIPEDLDGLTILSAYFHKRDVVRAEIGRSAGKTLGNIIEAAREYTKNKQVSRA